ncbi:hypothetical protein K1T71_009549 [Dendrolimus kikuchii]|uniref:Uncharacterized protein n=1 Tax=Dendrolimus kikuchii TaxID=765133 RepID=A0ACC1CSD1_9NEOP|nr:hypothetical protein K1T71_009549 [Dendrolimus kikuchii]
MNNNTNTQVKGPMDATVDIDLIFGERICFKQLISYCEIAEQCLKWVAFAEWADFKPKTILGQLPVLEIDGKQYAQSLAIARYLGRKYGLAGDNNEEALEIDQNVDFLNDIRIKAAAVFYEQNAEIKQKKHEEMSKDVYPALLKKLNDIIVKNGGYLAAGKLSWGDFVLTGMLDYLKAMMQVPDLEEQFPAFKKLSNNVLTIPNVKAYCDMKQDLEFDF